MNRLFIYGSLAPNEINGHILKGIGGTWEEATVKGILYEKGWGAQMGFPGIILDNSASKIDGYLFTCENLDKKWDFLDDFEGEEYERVIAEVKLANNKYIDAFIYTLKD